MPLLTIFLVIIFVISAVGLVFAIIAFNRANNSPKVSSSGSSAPGSETIPGNNVYVNNTALTPNLVLIDVVAVANPTTINPGPGDNGTTYYLVNDGIAGTVINFTFSDLALIKDGYYLNIVNNSAEAHSIGTNISGASISQSIPSGGTCKIVKNVTTTKSSSNTTRLISGIVVNTI
jgi:hypothetical protein